MVGKALCVLGLRSLMVGMTLEVVGQALEWSAMMVKFSNIEEKKEKNKRAQGKGILDRPILFLALKTP